MDIYIILFIVIAAAAIAWEIRPFRPLPLLIFFGLFLVCFAGLRAPGVDKDYLNYDAGLTYIELINNNEADADIPFFEPAFYLVATTMKFLFPTDYVVAVMIFFAFCSILLKLTGIAKMSINPFLVLLLYYAHFFLLHEMTQIRAGLAAGFMFIGVYYYVKGNLKAFLLIILLACVFHYSSILYLSVLLLRRDSINRLLWAGILFSGLVFSIIRLPLLQLVQQLIGSSFNKLSGYLQLVESGLAEDINTLNVLSIMNMLASGALLMVNHPQLKKMPPYFPVLLKLNILSIMLLGFFSDISALAFRVSEIFSVVSMFTFSFLIIMFSNRLAGLAVVLAIAIISFYINLFYGQLLAPYSLVFEHIYHKYMV